MSATLYHGEPNGPSLTVLAAAFEKNVALEQQWIDLAAGARHGNAVPHAVEIDMSIEGEGPVLVVDGTAMADSVFIACYLDDVGSGPALRPIDPYARWEVMAWCRYVIERVAPAAAFLGTRAQLSADLAKLDDLAFAHIVGPVASSDLADRWRAVRANDFPEDKIADSRSKIAQAVDKIEKQLDDGRDWLIGDFGIADLESYAWLAGTVSLVPDAFADAPRTQDWLARVKARPSVARALSLASTATPELAWAPGPEINRWG
jgi:GST-like protein